MRETCSSQNDKTTFGLGKGQLRLAQYLQTSNSRVSSVGELLLGHIVQSPLVTGDPIWQETLVTGSVSDGVGCGTRQADENRVIGKADISQTKSHPLSVQVPGPCLLTV